jgi:putative peptide zinc metalloprotease protein
MSTLAEKRYVSIPLSVQEDGDHFLVGSVDLGDFYQFPEQGVRVLSLLQSGNDVSSIKNRLAAEYQDSLDIEDFIEQLRSIGFIHADGQQDAFWEKHKADGVDKRRAFNVDRRVAQAIFSAPLLACYAGLILYAAFAAVQQPSLRLNLAAFYTDRYRTALLLLVLVFSALQVVLHESGHMLAAAMHGIKSRYGISNRLWTIVAQSDLTGILALPKSQRYFPMLAGMLVDVLCMAVLTILLQVMLLHGITGFAVQVVQAMVLEVALSIPWQFNIFIKTDIYFVLCTYFNQPDLDSDAFAYVRHLMYRASFGRFGSPAGDRVFRNLPLLRLFSLVWLLGRIVSLAVLVTIFVPTMARYAISAVELFTGARASFWAACDMLVYVCMMFTMLGIGMFMWIRQK